MAGALLTLAGATRGEDAASRLPSADEPPDSSVRSLAGAPPLERQTLDRLLGGDTWPRRAVAAMRLERFRCDESRELLDGLSRDQAWQVRAFAVRSLGRRRAWLAEASFDDEQEPRVLRAVLRYGYATDLERLGRGVRFLDRSENLEDKMLGVELAVASGDRAMAEAAWESVRTIILRMGRIEAGSLSPRLAAVTGQPDVRRHYRWRKWLRKAGRHYVLLPAFGRPVLTDDDIAPGLLAALSTQQFADLEVYIDDLSRRSVDLAICLDCTASMSAELAGAQGGIDDLMLFGGDVVKSMRVAIVGYRDRRDEFETKGWEFTDDIDLARRRLWSLMAAGGGDTPEAVYPALRMAYAKLGWNLNRAGVVVLVGDAPPHVGLGTRCVQMAEQAAAAGVTTHVIEADRKSVKHVPEIAAAGRGRCVSLPEGEGDSLIVEIAGLTLGDRFQNALREFFRTYLELCR